MPNNPHDALFTRTFSIKSEAIAFVQQFMPKWISESVIYDSFEQSDTSYITDELKEFFSDIVYTCQWKGSKVPIEISFLLEHKSYVPSNVYIQLNRYLVEGYQKQHIDQAKKRLTLILPVIVYHGKQRWRKRQFSDHFDLPDERLAQYIPSYEYELVDLMKISDDWIIKLSVGHFLKSAFLVFKHKDDKKFLYQFQEEIFIFVEKALDEEQRRSFLIGILTYIFSAFSFSVEEADTYFKQLKVPDMVEYVKGSVYEELMTKGLEQGIQKGELIGKKLNQISLITDLFFLQKVLGVPKIVELSKTKKTVIEKFFKVLEKKDAKLIRKSALALFFTKVELRPKYHEKLNKIITTFIEKANAESKEN